MSIALFIQASIHSCSCEMIDVIENFFCSLSSEVHLVLGHSDPPSAVLYRIDQAVHSNNGLRPPTGVLLKYLACLSH